MHILRHLAAACCIALVSVGCTTAPPPAPAASPAILGKATFASASSTEIRADYLANGTVKLTFPDGGTQIFKQAISGSGIRFVSGNDEWWEHQGEASYRHDGILVFIGRRK